MGTDVRPLPIWPHDLPADRLELIKRAKASMTVPFKITPAPAVPGSPGRILAFGEVPDFYCETVLIRPENVDSLDSVRAALTHVLTAPAGAPGSFTEEMWLSAVMQCDVRFVEEILPEPARQGDGIRLY